MSKKDKRLLRLMRRPAKVLSKARDLYIHSLTGCAGQVSYGTVMGCPTGQFSTVPRTTNTTKLPMRSISFNGQVENKPTTQQQQQQQEQEHEELGSSTSMANAVRARNPMPRSFSLGVIGRIDEDKPYCEFDEDELPVATEVLLRSTSCCFNMNWTS